MDIHDKRILVTGASGGLGQAIARALAAEGARLLITARNETQLNELAATTGAEVVVADLATRSDVARLAEMARGCDALVANAGLGGDSTIDAVTVDEIDNVIDVNLRAPIVLATEFAQAHIKAREPGHIVLIGSLSGLAPSPESRMYNATKFGLRGYSHALRQDLAPHRIGVTHVAPGFIRNAGMFANSDIDLPKGVRTKTPGDVASAVVKAIRANPGEIFVSPLELRLGATFATVAPGINAKVQGMLDASGRQHTNSSMERQS